MPDLLSEITHAARAYYGQWLRITATETDFQDWLRDLAPGERRQRANSSLALASTQRSFQRFCLEWRGFSMREFMLHRLSIEAFTLWQANREFDGDLPESLRYRPGSGPTCAGAVGLSVAKNLAASDKS